MLEYTDEWGGSGIKVWAITPKQIPMLNKIAINATLQL